MCIFIFCNENLPQYKETATFLMVPISFVAELIALRLALCLFPYGQKPQSHQQGKRKEDPRVLATSPVCIKAFYLDPNQ